MKLAIVGSRGVSPKCLDGYIPCGVSEVVTGGARGVDRCAREYALSHGLTLTEFLPDYRRYGRGAPLRRNVEIVSYADELLVFWDGSSRGTAFTLQEAKRQNKKVQLVLIPPQKEGDTSPTDP